MRILSLDVSTKTGYALIDENGKIESSGVIRIKYKSRGEAIHLFYDEIRFLVDITNPSLIVIEKPFFRGSGSRLLTSFCGLIEMIAYRYNLIFKEVHNAEIKKFMTGKGHATKDMMINKIKELGYSPQDDNEADAISLALYSFKNLT